MTEEEKNKIEEAYNILNSKIDLDTNKLEEDKQ